MNCLAVPEHGPMALMTPDYGRGVEWACYRCDPCGRRFIDSSPESLTRSSEALATSARNAAQLLAQQRDNP